MSSLELEHQKECIDCNLLYSDLNELRRHRETVHGGCAYCIISDLSLDHVIKKHRVCVFCHSQGIYAPLMRGREDEIEHLKKYHPRPTLP
jgi:hypothetical protein